jgi:hypothetical protein
MPPAHPIEILYCCSDSNKDQQLRQELEKHLSILKWEGVITSWHKGLIGAGTEWKSEIDRRLQTADIILPLISSDFIASDHNWNVVVQQAMERHKTRTARVIPILLRPTIDNWKIAFGNIKALPEGEKFVTDWKPYDRAFVSIAKGIREVVEELSASPFSLKSYPQLKVGVTAVARTLASVSTVTASLFPKKLKSRRRKQANLRTVITSAVIGLVGGTIAINHLPHMLGIPSSVPNLTFNSTQNVTPMGWIRIGVVNNTSGRLSTGERLIQSSNRRLAPSIDSPVIPLIGEVVTVKNPVNLRKDRPKAYLPESLALLKPGEKLVIVKVEPLVISDANLPRKEVWAQVGRCNRACNR